MGPGAAPKPDHLPSLDGLRAVSIVLVLFGHASGTRNFGVLPKPFGDLAHLGVVVFFVISGFLITSLLVSEARKHGRVSLKLFYARRAIRIFPASYLYLGVVAILSALGVVAVTRRDLWAAVLYVVNYLPDRSWQIGHLWSLSVEEQFYLIWPFAFAMLGVGRAVWAAAAMMAVAPAARLLAALTLRGTPYLDLEMFPMVGDALAAGSILAVIRPWLERQAWYVRLLGPGWSVLALLSVLVLNRYAGYTIVAVVGGSVIDILLAVLIHRSVYWPGDAAGRLLNWRPLASVGLLSYSLYLWQQLFLNRSSEVWMNAFPQNLVFTAVAAVASFYVVEKPFQKLRSRLRR